MDELTAREKRAIMLETQTPAYAQPIKARRAIDNTYRKAKSLRRAFADAGMDMPVNVRVWVPYKNKYVSGLNVPANLSICVGRDEIKSHTALVKRSKRALEARNAS